VRQIWLSRTPSNKRRLTTGRTLPFLGQMVLAGSLITGSLGGCSMMPGMGRSDAPLGATVTNGGVERKSERDDIAGKKMALDTSDSSFAGAIVADEPTAALAARNILERGGNAADAATALYFALSVTYPAAAGLGGGGVCLARAGDKSTVESISFLARVPSRVAPSPFLAMCAASRFCRLNMARGPGRNFCHRPNALRLLAFRCRARRAGSSPMAGSRS